MRFSELTLHPEVMKGIEAAGFVDCMLVQEKVYPAALQGKDVMVQSKTGSGKTAVFLVTILQKFVIARDTARTLPPDEAFKVKLPVALIVAPTRELAVQIEEDAIKLSSGIPEFRIGCFYGGVGYAKQDKQITEGLDLMIGTPGRLLDYQQMGKLNYKNIDSFIIDEADRLFDMGFYPDIQKMFSMMVPREQRQTMLFSATLSTRVRNLAWDYMNSPQEIEVQPEEITVKAITQELYHVSKEDKFLLFLRLLAREKPDHALIFSNTKAKAVELSKRLGVNGYHAQYLMGDLPQSKRLSVINKMKRGDLQFLVATDVAARGLQIDDLELVFNYDIPEDFESYVHRIGRTARAGKSGKSITLACEQFVYGLEAIENYIQMKIPVIWVGEGDLPEVEDKSAKMRFRDLVDESEYASLGGGDGRSSSRGGRSVSRSSSRPGTKPGTRPGTKAPSTARSKGPRDSSPRSKSRPTPSSPVRTKSPASLGPVAPRPIMKKKGKSYAEIQKMDFEERIAYYKQVYGTEGSPVLKSNDSQTSGSSGEKSISSSSRRSSQKPRKTASSESGTRRSQPNERQPATTGAVPAGKLRSPKPTTTVQGEPRPARTEVGKEAPVSTETVQPGKKSGLLKRLFQRVKGDA
jgi:ATP-dependent RNA helicase RhlB